MNSRLCHPFYFSLEMYCYYHHSCGPFCSHVLWHQGELKKCLRRIRFPLHRSAGKKDEKSLGKLLWQKNEKCAFSVYEKWMETKLKTLLLQCYQLSLIDEKLQSGITDDTMASTICSLIGEVTITSINGDYIREVMVTSKNATICSLILVTLILVTSH